MTTAPLPLGLFLLLALPLGTARADEPASQAVAGVLLPSGASAETLPSGVDLVIVPVPTEGRVAVEVRVGLPTEGSDLDGMIARLLDADRGSASGPARRQRRRLLGATSQVSLVDGGARIRLTGSADDLAELLALEANRLSDLAPTPTEVQWAADAVSAQRRRVLADPDQLVLALVRAPVALPSPVPAAALEARLAGRWTGAAVDIVVAGDVEPGPALDAARAVFSRLSPQLDEDQTAAASPAALPGLGAMSSGAGVTAVEATLAGAGVPRVAVAWPAPPIAPGTIDAAARDVLCELLVGRAGVLHQRLGGDEPLVVELGGPRLADGVVVTARLLPHTHPGAVLAAIEQAASRLVADQPDAELDAAVARARRHLAHRALLSLEEAQDWAGLVGTAMAAGQAPQAVEEHLHALGQVNLDAVRAQARAILRPENRHEAVLLPEGVSLVSGVEP